MTTLIRNKTNLALYCFVILIFSSAFCQIQAQEVEDEHEFSYDERDVHGPAKWGTIHPEWSSCGNGKMQSPIDMLSERVEIVSHLGRLKRSYRSSNATLTNRGHDIMLSWVNGAGHIDINGTSYQLRQFHWHSPSEHSINGIRFDLEAHMVHQSSDGKIAVVGILYKTGRPDSFLSMLEKDLKALADTKDVEKVIGFVDPKQIKIGSRKYYRYTGSLTTPPCTENVTWTISKKVRTVSKHQVKIIREAVHDRADANARPVQPLNARSVKMYRPNVGIKN